MWTYKKEDLIEEVNLGGNFIEKSGAYEVSIKNILNKKTKGGAEQLDITVETKDGLKAILYYVYKDKEGKEIDFKVRHLNHLCVITKTKPDDLTKFIGKDVGVFLKAKLSQDEKFINMDIEGFYYPDNKQTAKEREEKTPATVYNKAIEKYEAEAPLVKKAGTGKVEEKQVSVADVEFPF